MVRVMKFGGTSVATAESIERVVAAVTAARQQGPVAVVVSALGGVTNALLGCAREAAAGEDRFRERFAGVAARHREALGKFGAEGSAESRAQALLLQELEGLLEGCFLVREASPRTLDSVAGYGERLSAPIVAAALRHHGTAARPWDARELIRTDSLHGAARVDWDLTRQQLLRRFTPEALERAVPVITGFVAAGPEGETTTLGRGGSDLTASLVGAALEASVVELWTDVDGVLTADPRIVASARALRHLSYVELMELSHFGAKVVYPPSVRPTREAGIPLWIKNTFHPEAPGTCIDDHPPEAPATLAGTEPPPVRGIASIKELALLRLEGDGMVGVPGIAGRLFGALARRGVNIILITQASSEHSISLGVAPGDLRQARQGIDEEFALEQRAGLIDPLVVEEGLAVVALVGAGMRERAGLAGRIFSQLGRHGINVRAIAQGSSELNISLVVAGEDEGAAIRVLHRTFFEEEEEAAELYLAGVGGVGGALLEQLAAVADPRLRLVAVAGSRGVAVDPGGIPPESAIAAVRASEASEIKGDDKVAGTSEAGPLGVLLAAFKASRGERRVLVDCTASAAVTAAYDAVLEAGGAVVTANKLRPAGPVAGYRPLAAALGRTFFHEATVGAGLPVLRTVADFRATGDRLLRVEGLLSGTLTYLMDRLQSGEPFSAAVRAAHGAGYTEPDPREDLGGRDVARKLLILARLAGLESMEMEDIAVESLLAGDGWSDLTAEAFWERLPSLDETLEARHREAEAAGERLVVLASLDVAAGRGSVGLRAVPAAHPAAGVRGTDNLIALTTERYRATPLVIQGPGAGTEVTAAGVFGDILAAIARRRP